jgi:hypothetical protein
VTGHWSEAGLWTRGARLPVIAVYQSLHFCPGGTPSSHVCLVQDAQRLAIARSGLLQLRLTPDL